MALYKNYYTQLQEKFASNLNDIISKLIANYFKNEGNKYIHIAFPLQDKEYIATLNVLYESLSKQIFQKFADFPALNIGDKLKRKGGKSKDIYQVKRLTNDTYTLEQPKNNTNITVKYDALVKNYVPVQQSGRDNKFKNYETFFADSIKELEFTPVNFSKKTVFVATKTQFDNLTNKAKIPTIYLPCAHSTEQHEQHTIEILKDCVAYVSPKYDTCYNEILRNNIKIDTLVVCTDLDKLSQIIQDQNEYGFKLIVFTNKQDKPTECVSWVWKKEELDLLNGVEANVTQPEIIENLELTRLFDVFEANMQYIQNLEYPIQINSYGYFVRAALNAITLDDFDYLLKRLAANKELENNEQGYGIDSLGNNNPKKSLLEWIEKLRKSNLKLNKLGEILKNKTSKLAIIADRDDIDYLKNAFKNIKNTVFLSEKELKKRSDLGKYTLLYYSFNYKKDFEYIHALKNNVILLLYQQEYVFYQKAFATYTQELEKELCSEHRFALCGIKYEPAPEATIHLPQTLENMLHQLDERSQTAYDGYKEENDSILDELEENLMYELAFSDGAQITLESNDTVFDANGKIQKVYQLKENQQVRLYPKDELAEKLYEIATQTEPEVFGKMEQNADFWLNLLKELHVKYGENLHQQLQQRGLKVSEITVKNNYLKRKIKFPMQNNDLKAILELGNKSGIFSEIKKSKQLYNGTMIALGRGIKQELSQFLQNKTLGEILQKKQFTAQTLHNFVAAQMPLKTIKIIKIQ